MVSDSFTSRPVIESLSCISLRSSLSPGAREKERMRRLSFRLVEGAVSFVPFAMNHHRAREGGVSVIHYRENTPRNSLKPDCSTKTRLVIKVIFEGFCKKIRQLYQPDNLSLLSLWNIGVIPVFHSVATLATALRGLPCSQKETLHIRFQVPPLDSPRPINLSSIQASLLNGPP